MRERRNGGEQGGERRTHPRTPLVLKVEYSSQDGFIRDYTTNISQGGTMIRTNRQLAVGDPVDLMLSFPGLLAQISLAAHVRWISAEESGELAAGLEFDKRDSRTWAEFTKLVERISAGDEQLVTSDVMRVLVIEDNPHVAQLIQRALESHLAEMKAGFEVRHAHDCHQAWTWLQDEPFDLLITDIYLPGMSGETFIRQTRADPRWSDLPIVAMTAAGVDHRERVLDAGADFFLSKPLRLVDLLNTFRRLGPVRKSGGEQ